jgi:hypothetical protein
MQKCAFRAMAGPSEAWLKLPNVALVLGLSRQRVYQLVKDGRMPTQEWNGHLFVHHHDVQAFQKTKRRSDGSFRYL